jgi:NitT/TauT family transport system ATP-binding protein
MQNVVFGPKTRGERAEAYRPRAAQILEQMGLKGFEDSYPAELSGGMRQRVGIARVLMLESRVMLMDEPFGALDAQTRSLMQELLLSVWERHHQTVLFVTHDIEVKLPRPRALEITATPEFNALRLEVLALIREESLRAAAQT